MVEIGAAGMAVAGAVGSGKIQRDEGRARRGAIGEVDRKAGPVAPIGIATLGFEPPAVEPGQDAGLAIVQPVGTGWLQQRRPLEASLTGNVTVQAPESGKPGEPISRDAARR